MAVSEPVLDRLTQLWGSPMLRFLWRIKLRLRTWRVSLNVKCIQPGNRVRLGEADAVVYATFLNGALYLDDFIRHYQRLGVSKIVLIDNESTDESCEIISRYPEVCLLQSNLIYSNYHVAFRHFFELTYVQQGWGINVDIDEFLDFPGSTTLSLKQFLRYLNTNKYSAVAGYMLDRYSQDPLGQAGNRPGDDLSIKCPHYSLGQIKRRAYPLAEIGPRGSVGNEEILDYTGGVRARFFGARVQLSKFPLIRKRRAHAAGVHRIYNAHRADVSVVLNHYRFLDDVEAVARNFRKANHQRYNNLLTLFDGGGDAVVYQDGDNVWRGVDALVEEGFLKVSDRYQAWVKEHGKG